MYIKVKAKKCFMLSMEQWKFWEMITLYSNAVYLSEKLGKYKTT